MHVFYKASYWVFMTVVLSLGGLLALSLIPLLGIEIKIVKSGSMEPVIRTGSIVIDRPATTYNVGDVVTFGADTKTQIPTTHRIIEITSKAGQQFITTKGDSNDAPDPVQTPLSAVHGKVLFSVPYLGYALAFARQPLGFSLLVGVPALTIIVEELLKIVREIERLRRKKILSHATPTPQRRRIVVD